MADNRVSTITLTDGTKYDIGTSTGAEYVRGTWASATNVWTGVTKDQELYDGKEILLFLPFAGNSSATTLNLTLKGGETGAGTTGAKNVYFNGTTRHTTQYGQYQMVRMTYHASHVIGSTTYEGWWIDYARDTNDLAYSIRYSAQVVKAKTAITSGRLIVGTNEGYVNIASGVTFDLSYKILYASGNIEVGDTANTTYELINAKISNNKSGWTGTQYSEAYLVLSQITGKTATIDSEIITTTVPTTEDGKYYIPLGAMYSTTNCVFHAQDKIFAFTNGYFHEYNSDPDVATKQYVDSAIPTVMIGATASANGASGLVPQPLIADKDKFLKGDGTWEEIEDTYFPELKARNDFDAGYLIVGNASGYRAAHQTIGFVITYPTLFSTQAVQKNNVGYNCALSAGLVNLRLTNNDVNCGFEPYKLVFIKGILDGVSFIIDTYDIFTQTVPSVADGNFYYSLGYAISANNVMLLPYHEVYRRDENGWFGPVGSTIPMIGASASANGKQGVVPKPVIGDESKFLKGDGTWEVVSYYGTCSTAAATVAKEVVCPEFTNSNLVEGVTVRVKFTNTNSATGPTLNVNSTGPQTIYRYGTTTPSTSASWSWYAGAVVSFTYDGSAWIMNDMIGNDNTYDREYWNAAIKAASAITAGTLICGSSSGWNQVAKGIAFDIAYPILYMGTAIAVNKTRSDGYASISVNTTVTNGGVSPAFTLYLPVFLKGKLVGSIFTIDSTTLFTQTVPNTDDGFQYYEVGVAYSATNLRLIREHKIFAYYNGAFQEYTPGILTYTVVTSGLT